MENKRFEALLTKHAGVLARTSGMSDQYRAALDAAPESLRVYVMGLEAAVRELETIRARETKTERAIRDLRSRVSRLEDNRGPLKVGAR